MCSGCPNRLIQQNICIYIYIYPEIMFFFSMFNLQISIRSISLQTFLMAVVICHQIWLENCQIEISTGKSPSLTWWIPRYATFDYRRVFQQSNVVVFHSNLLPSNKRCQIIREWKQWRIFLPPAFIFRVYTGNQRWLNKYSLTIQFVS